MKVKQIYAHYDRKKTLPAGEFQYCPHCRTELVSKANGGRERPTCLNCGFIQFKNPAPAVSILVIDQDKVLLGQRSGDPGAGQWALPSGYVEYEDDFITTAVKETREETGLKVEIHAVLNIVSSFLTPRFHFLGIYVLAQVVGGKLWAGDDLEAVDWYPLSGPLPEMAFVEDADIIAWYARNHPQGLTGSRESLAINKN